MKTNYLYFLLKRIRLERASLLTVAVMLSFFVPAHAAPLNQGVANSPDNQVAPQPASLSQSQAVVAASGPTITVNTLDD